MPLAGGWSGRWRHSQLEAGRVVVFPGDKKVRDRVHARLAQRVDEKAARKLEQQSEKQVGV